MRKDFYTEQELLTMPLSLLRGLDIESKDQEKLVQKVVNIRLNQLPPSQPIFRRDVPDIENQEQEKEWQQKINERTAKLKPRLEDETPQQSPDSSPEPKSVPETMKESAMAQPQAEGTPVVLSSKVPKSLTRKSK